MQPVDLDDATRRSERYWNVDGLPELIMGLLWIVWGGAWLFGESLAAGPVRNFYWALTPALLAGSGFAAVWVTKRLKARLTFPRTGYVEWRQPSRSVHLIAGVIAIVTALVLAAAVMNAQARSGELAAPIFGVILSLAFVVASLRQRAPHLLALAAVSIALGLALGAISGGWTSVNWMFVALGGASVLLGAIRLARFLRAHPRASLEGA
jgi:hypothetical protein